MEMYEENRSYDIVAHKEERIGRFTIVQDIISIDGERYPYSFEKVDDAVCILPIIDEHVILIRQYRHSIGKWIWELPAGGLSGDDPAVAAARELREETGFIAKEWKELGCYYVSPGTSSSKTYFFTAFCNVNLGKQCEKTELIEVHKIPFMKYEEMLYDHIIEFSGAMMAWQLYKYSQGKEK